MSRQTYAPFLATLFSAGCMTVDGGPGLDLAESGADAIQVGDIDGDGAGDLELRLCTARPLERTGWGDGTCPEEHAVPLLGGEPYYPASTIEEDEVFVSLRVVDREQPRFSCGDGTLLGGRPRVCALEEPRLAMIDLSFVEAGGDGEVTWSFDRAGAALPFWPAIFAGGEVPIGGSGTYTVEATVIRGGRVDIADRPINQPDEAWWLLSEDPAYLQSEIDRRTAEAGPATGYRPFPLHATWAFADDGTVIGADAMTVRFQISVTPDLP